MLRNFLLALALVGLVLPVAAQTPARVEQVILATAWDLDGEGADADQVIVATAIVDDGTSVGGADWTIVAQPDTCRLLDLTIVDTNLTAGSITVTGTDCFGEVLVSAFAFTAGDDTGTATLTVTSGLASGAYYASVTTVTTGTMTGEDTETFALGYAGDATPAQYPLYGKLMRVRGVGDVADAAQAAIGTNALRWISPFGTYKVNLPITTSDAVSTTVTAVSDNGAFTNVSVGDLLIVNQGGAQLVRKVTARASANSITVNASLFIDDDGIGFEYKKFWVLADPIDGWIPVDGWDAAGWIFDVDANANTGGVISDITCAVLGPTYEPQEQIDTDTVASAATGEAVTSLDLRLAPQYTHCRFGVEFGTNDDADAADEDINVVFGLRR
jgi:hypothetical protein